MPAPMSRGVLVGAITAVLFGAACGDDGGTTVDASTAADSGTTTDAAVVDSATSFDGALPDAPLPDATPADAASADATTQTFSLTFNGGTSYAGPHSGQSFQAAVLLPGFGIVSMTAGTVPSGDWTFMFNGFLQAGNTYELHIWIDSNFGGGTTSVCDGSPTFNDHQWSYSTGVVAGDIVLNQPHNTSFTDVCSSF